MDFQVTVAALPVMTAAKVPLQVAFTHKPMVYWCRYKHPKSGKLGWWQLGETQMRIKLKSCKLNSVCAKGDDLSEVDQALLWIMERNRVDYAIDLAGYPEGWLDCDGRDLLVTQSCVPLPAVDGDWPHIEKYLKELLGATVFEYQMAWWQWARKSIRLSDSMLPGQVMVYIGESGAGKSFLQKMTTRLLGGHHSNPFNYMSGKSSFNADLFLAEHLVIEDQFADTGGKGRREFGAKLKEMAVNQVVSCHGKGADAITLKPKWRVSMSMNDEKENLQVLPQLDASILDKIMLISCSMPEFPVDLATEDGWAKWDKLVTSELPALAHAIDTFEIPKCIKSARYGVKAWHDKDIIDSEGESSVEQRFYDILMFDLPTIDTEVDEWKGKSTDLERLLLGAAMPSVNQTRKILAWQGALGTYLGRLAKQYPTQFTRRRVRGNNIWEIKLPPTPKGTR